MRSRRERRGNLRIVGEKARREGRTIDGVVEARKFEVARIRKKGRALTDGVIARLRIFQHRISSLLPARDRSRPPQAPVQPANFITYKITADMGGKLRTGARTACNFWNRFVQPQYFVVIRLGIFTRNSCTIASAYKPYEMDGVRYCRVEFNTKYLGQFTEDEIAGTIVHEIGHSLGFGWDEWDKLFDQKTGRFKTEAVARLADLERMQVELGGGSGTAFGHWDSYKFDRELMSGYRAYGEYVLPVTIDLMEVLGHTVSERLNARTHLDELLQDAASMVFSRQDEVRRLDLEHFEETELFEIVPHAPPVVSDYPARVVNG